MGRASGRHGNSVSEGELDMARKPQTIDEYLATVSEDKRAALAKKLVRTRIAEHAR
jgi:hypothetical protein